jgi:hypothetical protein
MRDFGVINNSGIYLRRSFLGYNEGGRLCCRSDLLSNCSTISQRFN